MGALAAAKTALKGLINNSRSSSSSSASSDSGTTYKRVAQHAAGRYDVIGREDGKRYRGVPYIGPAPTGIVSSPALISENGAELIVNADDLNRLRRHINYPLVVQAIEDSRRPSSAPQVLQHAGGNYPLPPAKPSTSVPQAEVADPRLLTRLTTAIERLERNGVSASVVLTELERKQQLRNRARKIGSKTRTATGRCAVIRTWRPTSSVRPPTYRAAYRTEHSASPPDRPFSAHAGAKASPPPST